MSIYINPGSGAVKDDLGYENAKQNIAKFIEDCEIPLAIKKSDPKPDASGRYTFLLNTPLCEEVEWEVDMPSLPLGQVRFMDEEGQNIWHFPRLFIDGSSWVWSFAIITKGEFEDKVQEKIDMYMMEVNKLNQILENNSQD